MPAFLKRHPFAVEAFFESSVVFTFAAPQAELQHLIPGFLTPDSFDNKWGFIAVAMVQSKDLRPKGFPRFLGRDFFLVGYRVFVRFTNSAGKRLRGLYILKSETDKKMMSILGNIFTGYNYSTIDINQKKQDGIFEISSQISAFDVAYSYGNEDVTVLPDGSPFTNWKEARRFAGPLPFTFSASTNKDEVIIVEGVREDWKPKPAQVLHHQFGFLQNLGISNLKLASAFSVEHIPYSWEKGKLEKWK